MIIEPDQRALDIHLAKRRARGHGAYGLDAMVGTPEQIIARLREYVALGVTHFIGMFGRVDRLGATELFAREVMPAFKYLRPDQQTTEEHRGAQGRALWRKPTR